MGRGRGRGGAEGAARRLQTVEPRWLSEAPACLETRPHKQKVRVRAAAPAGESVNHTSPSKPNPQLVSLSK